MEVTAITDLTSEKLSQLGKSVVRAEMQAIATLIERIDDNFSQACRLILSCDGRVVVIGMGKSGHIGGKIAATLASTGTPAFFLHPGEANHGDLGMITYRDIALTISNSGETAEIVSLLPLIKNLRIPLIAITGNPSSTMAKRADVHLNIGVVQEACPLGLAPTSSTTATLVMGDAIALTLLEAKGFTAQDYARYHPAGNLGKRLLLRIEDVMRRDQAIPRIHFEANVQDALIEMTQKQLGMTSVQDSSGNLVGIYTDGDLRRTLNQGLDLHTTMMKQVMTQNYKKISPQMLAYDALMMMENHKVTSILVVDDQHTLLGVAHIHDLLNAGL
ncbi:MAG: KpsF/GutQ family sugar-phosphate isomerase [Gammaproteobacteria bacterium]|nr:KpsF/GutQ family sugar-phosphate isomerase [Gammaproteobacteria bacterium]